jgi:hypothetical protein
MQHSPSAGLAGKPDAQTAARPERAARETSLRAGDSYVQSILFGKRWRPREEQCPAEAAPAADPQREV